MATTTAQPRTVLERFPAGAPAARGQRKSTQPPSAIRGIDAQVVMDLNSDQFLVATDTTPQ